MDYKIVIPSFKRHDIICSKTIGLLIDYKIPMDKVYVFVVEEEFNKYKSVLPNLCNIVIGVKGVARQRDFIGSYFEDGQPLLSLDDDIVSLDQLDIENTTKTKPIKCLDTLVYETFYKLDTHELNLAGLYPVNNYYFLKEKDTTDLRFIIGQVKIYYNKKHLEKRQFYLLEDYETTLKYYLNDGGVLRLNNICINANIDTLKGGIEDRTLEKKKEEVARFKKKYDNYCEIKTKDNGLDIRLLKTPTLTTLTALWIGKVINPIVEVAWLSWLKQGYKVCVYISNLDKGKLHKSLRKFINNRLVFKNALKIMEFKTGEEILPFSDLWRYKFLAQEGGIWIDSDMILLDQLPHQEFIITTEHTFQSGGRRSKLTYKPNIGILKFNKNNDMLLRTIKRIEKYSLIDAPQFTDNMKLFQTELKKEDYEKYYIEPNMTCGVPWWDFQELYEDKGIYTTKYNVEVKSKNWLLTNAFALHCWEHFTIGNKIDVLGCPPQSLFGTIRNHYQDTNM
tara:strand:+ start:94 stop:1611 length:1518 start_codon:yes stop_codon:yes gene_type:complete